MDQKANAGGVFTWWITEKDGSLALDEHGLPRMGQMHNGNTTVGLNYLLNLGLSDTGAQVTTWYIGLVDNSNITTGFATADTLSSHSGWSEMTGGEGYPGRQAWGPGAASGGSVTNASAAAFAFTNTGTAYGMFVCSASSGTSGTLFSTAAFSSPQSLINGQTLNVTYTYSLS